MITNVLPPFYGSQCTSNNAYIYKVTNVQPVFYFANLWPCVELIYLQVAELLNVSNRLLTKDGRPLHSFLTSQ